MGETALIDWFSSSGNILSLISILIAIVAMYTSWKTQKRLVEIEEVRETDRQREMHKADLVAQSERGEKISRLVITNRGPAEAQEISVLINGKPLKEFPAFVDDKEIRGIGPHSSIRYRMAFTFGMDTSFDVTINWSDNSGEQGIYQTTLMY
jgi:hypothetical protein